MDGLLLVDKPAGLTSADVVRVVKRVLRVKTGHLGTLDPFATGLLPICVGDGTKIAQFLSGVDKEYTGIIRLGTETNTGDRTGTVIATAAVPALDAARLEALARTLLGESLQVPPMHSAIKRQGVPLYKLARQGIEVERAPRRIVIQRLELAVHEPDAIAFTLGCSKGTYVRVLAQDIARALGSVGHLEELRRIRFGHFDVRDAVPLDAISAASAVVIGVREALHPLREVQVDAGTAQRARNGYVPVLREIPPGTRDELVKLIGPDGAVASLIVMVEHGGWRFARVFAVADGAI